MSVDFCFIVEAPRARRIRIPLVFRVMAGPLLRAVLYRLHYRAGG